MIPFNLMQNNFGGMHFTLKRTPGFQGKGQRRGARGREGEERDRREGNRNTHTFCICTLSLKQE